MKLTWNDAKRAATLADRGLDFADALHVFSGAHFTIPDDRQDYGEKRFVTIGLLSGRMVIIAWTPRGKDRRIISMRKANEREQAKYRQQFGQG